jgi:hypothetical protein
MNKNIFDDLKTASQLIIPVTNSDELRRVQEVLFSYGAGFTSQNSEERLQSYHDSVKEHQSIKCTATGELSIINNKDYCPSNKNNLVISAFQAVYNSLNVFSDRFGK